VTVPMARGMDPARDLAALAALVRILRTLQPDIVDASTPKAGLLLMLAATLTRVPCRIHTLRGLRFETMTGSGRAVLTGTTRLTCALAHRVLCVSPSLRRRAIALGVVPAHKAMVLGMGSGVDLARFSATPEARAQAQTLRRQHGIPADALVLGFVGRIARDKGFVELAAAWSTLRARCPRLHWIIAGPPDATDPVPPPIEAALDTDPRVHRLGHVDDPCPVYLAMDLLALPTYREGFGNVLIEAAALEIPTVATRVTGCVDAVEDGVTGTLVPPRDVDALVHAITAYAEDPALRARHGRAGRARAARLFRQEDLWARMHRTYLELARRAGHDTPGPDARGREA
jgi:glycosyltransferase involved in cell wall biosynthesis